MLFDVKHIDVDNSDIKSCAYDNDKFELNITTEYVKSEYVISISDYSKRIYNDIKVLKKGKKERLYYAHGMSDIDMYFENNLFVISHSPYDGVYRYFKFTNTVFEKLYNSLKGIYK